MGHSIFIKDLRESGYIPEGVVNWISLMGWSLDDKTEFFTMKDLEENFNLAKLNPSPAAINFTKLDYFNGLHIRHLSDQELAERLFPFFEAEGLNATIEKLEKIAPILKERLPTLDEAIPMAAFFFRNTIEISAIELVQSGASIENTLCILRKSLEVIETEASLDKERVEPILRSYAESQGFFGSASIWYIARSRYRTKSQPTTF